jgi:hypothetical protein
MSLTTFMETYAKELARAREKYPGQYVFPASEVPHVVERMRTAIANGSYNHDGFAFKWTCGILGIPYTRRAINAFVDGDP